MLCSLARISLTVQCLPKCPNGKSNENWSPKKFSFLVLSPTGKQNNLAPNCQLRPNYCLSQCGSTLISRKEEIGSHGNNGRHCSDFLSILTTDLHYSRPPNINYSNQISHFIINGDSLEHCFHCNILGKPFRVRRRCAGKTMNHASICLHN